MKEETELVSVLLRDIVSEGYNILVTEGTCFSLQRILIFQCGDWLFSVLCCKSVLCLARQNTSTNVSGVSQGGHSL